MIEVRQSHRSEPAIRGRRRPFARDRGVEQHPTRAEAGFDALPVDEQIDYVQSLWDRIAATVGQVPLQEWQQALLEERLAAHRRTPDEARPWEEVIGRVQERLRDSR